MATKNPSSPKKIASKVKNILKKYNLLLKYMVLGATSLTRNELKLLIKEGLIEPKHIRITLGNIYTSAHSQMLRRKSRKNIRDFALKHIQQNAGEFIDQFMDKMTKDISSIANTETMLYRQAMKDIVRDELAQGVLRQNTMRQMARRLRDRTKDYAKDWDRVVTTELVQAQNLGAVDAIIENNPDKKQTDVYVYKSGPLDGKTCKYCQKFWFIRNTTVPKVYRLSDLVSSGTNIGKKAAQWEATIGTTHPHCRHLLQELPKGWGFDIGGRLQYVGRDHDEYKSQQ